MFLGITSKYKPTFTHANDGKEKFLQVSLTHVVVVDKFHLFHQELLHHGYHVGQEQETDKLLHELQRFTSEFALKT